MNDTDFASWSPGEVMLEDRSGLSFDWLEIDDDGESFAAMRALSQAEKQALFAACVARTVKGQLAFEPLARPELEVTVARLDIDFASHVRPTADMLWSRINKGRILDIARSVLSPAWASARSKNKKPDLAKAMEQAFAAGDPPLGLHADDHAAALAWVPPGFAAFDTGRVEDEPEDAAAAEPAAAASGPDPEPVAGPAADAESPETPADPPRTNSVVESVEAPAVAERRAAERATGNGNDSGNDHATPAAPETDSAAGDHRSDARVDGPESGAAEPAKPADIAARHPGTGERPRCRRRARHSRVPAPRTGAFRRQLTARHGPSCAPPDRRPAGRFRFRILRGDVCMNHIARTPPAKIRARIHDNALKRVTRIYASTLADVLTETLQNSRRGGATGVRISVGTLTDRPGGETRFTVTIADDGTGIADPAVLLSFGENGWSDDLVRREDAAGFGFASLSRRGCTVASRRRSPDGQTQPGWRVDLGPGTFPG